MTHITTLYRAVWSIACIYKPTNHRILLSNCPVCVGHLLFATSSFSTFLGHSRMGG